MFPVVHPKTTMHNKVVVVGYFFFIIIIINFINEKQQSFYQ